MEKSGSLQFGRHIRNVGRFTQIINVLARHGFWSVLEGSGIKSWLTPEQVKQAETLSSDDDGIDEAKRVANALAEETSAPRRFREALEELGPAFVKLGQLLASREDLMPEAYLRELRKLHQTVSALPYTVIRKVLEDELGDQGLAQFSEISQTPLAAGSIGQVHPAILKTGQRVVVKVQRPNIAEQIRTDLALMELLAGLLEKYLPELRSVRPQLIVQEFMRGIEGELDFIREAGSTSKIADNFSEIDYVQLPDVYWALTTAKVLTLSFVEGYSLLERDTLEKSGFDLPQLVERGSSMFLQMVFVDGLYHGDLHAGNLLALPDNRIGVLDCGLTIRLSRGTRENLAGLLVALVEEDYESLVSHFVELADPSHHFDINAFEEAVANELTPYVGLKLKKIRVGRLLWRIAKISAEHGAPMPRQLILFFKTFTSFEGIGSSLSPDFDIIQVCEKFSSKLVKGIYSKENIERQGLTILRDMANLAKFAPRQVRGLLKQLAQGEMQINVSSKDLHFAASSLDRLVSRIAVSVILASLVIGSSILVLAKVGHEYYHMSSFGLYGFAIAGLLALYVVWSIIRGGGKF